MRHQKRRDKLSRTGSHRRSLIANMLKSLILEGHLETTLAKGKILKKHADKIVSLAKEDSLHHKRRVISLLHLRRSPMDAKEWKIFRSDRSNASADRLVLQKLFTSIAPKYAERNGGYTTLIKRMPRMGDNAPMCQVHFI